MSAVAIPDNETFQRFLAAADEGNLEQNPDQVSIDIIARILSADSVADVLGGSGTTHAREFLDAPFKLLGVHFNRSAMDNTDTGFYAVLDGVDAVDGGAGPEYVIDVRGGRLRVRLDAAPGHVQLSGPAVLVADGRWRSA